MPSRTARQIAATAEIEIMPLPIDFSTTVSMAWHRRAASELAQAWFRAQLIEAASDLSGLVVPPLQATARPHTSPPINWDGGDSLIRRLHDFVGAR